MRCQKFSHFRPFVHIWLIVFPIIFLLLWQIEPIEHFTIKLGLQVSNCEKPFLGLVNWIKWSSSFKDILPSGVDDEVIGLGWNEESSKVFQKTDDGNV
jgi:hypothetical protein